MSKVRNIFLVRHGQSRGNVDKSEYFKNLDCDVELTDKGKADAINAGDRIMELSDILQINTAIYPDPKNLPTMRYNLYCSTYKRAMQTGNILHGRMTGFRGFEINKFDNMPILREREWGGLRDIVELGKKTEDHFQFYYRPQNGESFADTYQRVMVFHQHLMTTSNYENNIIVAHGEFNKLYLMYLLGWSVEEFDSWKTPRNGEVYLIRDGELSSLTPLTKKHS